MNYYAILGLDKTATHQQIVAAFRRMAIKYHPDRNHSLNANEKFILVHKAFEVLGNPERRRWYDMAYAKDEHPHTSYKPQPRPSSNPTPNLRPGYNPDEPMSARRAALLTLLIFLAIGMLVGALGIFR